MQRTLNRDRVLEFESEIADMLKTLLVLKKEMDEVNHHRKDWLHNISDAHLHGSDVYVEKIELLRAQCELSSLNMKLDAIRLEGQYETQTLKMLIEATKPLGEEESEEEREQTMHNLARVNADELRDAIDHSIQYRMSLGSFVYDLTSSLQSLRLQTETEQRQQEEDWRHNIDVFHVNMIDSMKKSKGNYQKIVKEYLILRHNSQVAKEILVRSQNDAIAARVELQKCLDHITTEANAHRQRMEEQSNAELKMLTNDLRHQVIAKEREVEEYSIIVQEIQKQKSFDQEFLLKEIAKYDAKYQELEGKRKEDLKVIMHELKFLKQSIQSVEEKIIVGNRTPSTMTQKAVEESEGLLVKRLQKLVKAIKQDDEEFYRI
jgi:hypothetical protein